MRILVSEWIDPKATFSVYFFNKCTSTYFLFYISKKIMKVTLVINKNTVNLYAH